MTLDEHPQFEELIGITADRLGILPELVRKDYWVVRCLRAIRSDEVLRAQVIFKGGTSLSKGWQIIDRFSEDVDLLTTGPNFSAMPGKAARKAVFAAILDAVEMQTPLRRPNREGLRDEEQRFLYSSGDKYKHCSARLPLPGCSIKSSSNSAEFILLEMGFRGSAHPTTTVSLNSFVAETIRDTNRDERLALRDYEADFAEFDFILLDPTLTFVEKLLAVHCSVSRGVEDVRTRHYYDIAALYNRRPEIPAMIDSGDFKVLLRQAIDISNVNFEANVDLDLDLTRSPALNLTDQQTAQLDRQYQREARFYFKGQPPFREITATVSQIREHLAALIVSKAK